MTPEPDRNQALLEFLARFEAHCPRCNYDLRQLTSCRCPECGTELRLDVHAAKEKLGCWIAALIGAGLPAGLGILCDCIMLAEGAAINDSTFLFALIASNAALLLLIGLVILRRRFTSWEPNVQSTAAMACWLPAVVIFFCVLSVM